jgi:alkaline phosphatase D
VSETPVTRRSFLAGTAAMGLGVALAACSDDDAGPATAAGSLPPVPDLPDDPFRLGVASGDPLPDGVVLWTRLLPAAGAASLPTDVPVRWAVTTDAELTDVVADGVAVATAPLGHSVHVDARGLDPATTYHYAFSVGQWASPVGRTRTAPDRGADVDAVRLGVTSCQAWQSGWFTPYRDMAATDLDAVVFLGDFIYELEASVAVRPHGLAIPVTLDEFRGFYELNCSDPDLRAARLAHPWIVTWDDHEVEDNYAALQPGALGAEAAAEIPGGFAAKRAAAYQAWWEHQPVRGGPPVDGNLEVHRALRFGDLVTVAVVDTRQYRTPQPTGDGAGNLPRLFGGGPQLPGAFDPAAQMLGEEQEAWLAAVLGDSEARWNLVAEQSVIAPVNRRPDTEGGYSMDSWDGYVVPRQRLIDTIVDEEVTNPVFLGGDIHTSAVLDVHRDPTDPSTPVVASELIAPSLSAVELLQPEAVQGARSNPHIKLYDIERRGWLRLELTPDEATARFRYTDTTVVDAPTTDGTAWRIADGAPGAVAIDGPT